MTYLRPTSMQQKSSESSSKQLDNQTNNHTHNKMEENETQNSTHNITVGGEEKEGVKWEQVSTHFVSYRDANNNTISRHYSVQKNSDGKHEVIDKRKINDKVCVIKNCLNEDQKEGEQAQDVLLVTEKEKQQQKHVTENKEQKANEKEKEKEKEGETKGDETHQERQQGEKHDQKQQEVAINHPDDNNNNNNQQVQLKKFEEEWNNNELVHKLGMADEIHPSMNNFDEIFANLTSPHHRFHHYRQSFVPSNQEPCCSSSSHYHCHPHPDDMFPHYVPSPWFDGGFPTLFDHSSAFGSRFPLYHHPLLRFRY